MAVFDRETLMIRVNYDEELMSELIELSLQDLPARLEKLKENFTKKNIQEIVSIAHTIKGASLNMAFDDLAHTAMDLEHSAKNNNFVNVQKAIENLRRDYRNLCLNLSA